MKQSCSIASQPTPMQKSRELQFHSLLQNNNSPHSLPGVGFCPAPKFLTSTQELLLVNAGLILEQICSGMNKGKEPLIPKRKHSRGLCVLPCIWGCRPWMPASARTLTSGVGFRPPRPGASPSAPCCNRKTNYANFPAPSVLCHNGYEFHAFSWRPSTAQLGRPYGVIPYLEPPWPGPLAWDLALTPPRPPWHDMITWWVQSGQAFGLYTDTCSCLEVFPACHTTISHHPTQCCSCQA